MVNWLALQVRDRLTIGLFEPARRDGRIPTEHDGEGAFARADGELRGARRSEVGSAKGGGLTSS